MEHIDNKKLFVFEMANNHMGDVLHGQRIIQEFAHAKEEYKEFELLKLARNSFYGVKLSYCNQLYNLCEKINVDYGHLREHFARGEWVGEQHTHVPGPDGELGFGGKCLPKDAQELVSCFKDHGIEFKMLKDSLEFNKNQRIKSTDYKNIGG